MEKERFAQLTRSGLVGLCAATVVAAPLMLTSVTIFGFNGWGASWGGPMIWIFPIVGASFAGWFVGRLHWRATRPASESS